MQSLSDYPDLIVEQCPLGCENCDEIYINTQTGHRIVCRCRKCGHNRKKIKGEQKQK